MRWPQFFWLLSANANTLKPAPVAPSSVHLPKWPQPKMTTPLVPSPTGLKPAEASGEPSVAKTSAISNDGCDRDADITWTPFPDYKATPRLFRQRLHDHVREELFARQEWEQVFERLGNKGAIGPLVALQARRTHLVGNDADIHQHRPRHREDAANLLAQAGLIFNDDRVNVVRRGDLREVGDSQAGGGVRADLHLAEVGLLRSADGSISIVVEHEELDRQLQPPHRLQFLDVELETAVAVHQDRLPGPGADTNRDRHRQAIAHRTQARGVEDALSAARGARQQKYLNPGARGTGDQLVLLLRFRADNLGEVEDRNQALGLAKPVCHATVARLPVGGAPVPLGPAGMIERLLHRPELRQQFLQERAELRNHRLLQVRVEFPELGRIDIDSYLMRLARQVLRSIAGDRSEEHTSALQ